MAFDFGAYVRSGLDTLVNKFHIILGTACQAAIVVYAFKFHKDLGPGIVNTVYAFYAFLAGHAFTYQKWPDSGAATPPVPDAQPQPDARLPRI